MASIYYSNYKHCGKCGEPRPKIFIRCPICGAMLRDHGLSRSEKRREKYYRNKKENTLI